MEILNKKLMLSVVTTDKTRKFGLLLAVSCLPQFYNNQITYEIEKAITSVVFGQDSIFNLVEKTQKKINKLLKQKKQSHPSTKS